MCVYVRPDWTQNSELMKQGNHKTAKNKTATIIKQRTLQNSEHNKTAIISKKRQCLFSSVKTFLFLIGQFTVSYDVKHFLLGPFAVDVKVDFSCFVNTLFCN